MFKLIATDMDGTFLRDDMTYDRDFFAKLHEKMQAQGIQWVVASGNQYFQLTSFFEAFPDTIYVAENGAYIRDANKVYALSSFENGAIQPILTKLTSIPDLKILVCGQSSAYALKSTDAAHIATARQYYKQLRLVDAFDNLDDCILKFAISCPPEKTAAIVAEMRQLLVDLGEPTSSGHGDIDIIQPGMNKAAGLATLGRHLNIQLDDMCAFGDGGNDLEMLREVGLGVAMANATPAVLAVADTTTKSNQEQGVLQFMHHLLSEP
ncbi:MAG: Cof-type HAD-IIB family hydrolase [Lacticaseibacillus paracasei]